MQPGLGFFWFRLVELSSRRPFTVPVASRYYGQALFSHNHFFFHLREAILQASGFYPFHLAPDLFAPPGLLGE